MFQSKKIEPKRWHFILIGVIIVTSIIFKIYYSVWPKATVVVGGQTLTVLVANTDERQYKGLSGKKSMGRYDGMLFVFSERGRHTMVMRDMNFALDIIWIDKKTVVDIAPNLPPQKGAPENELVPYIPRASSTIVLELPKGYTQKNNVRIGDEVSVIND